jgi:Uma2 family endonuclease
VTTKITLVTGEQITLPGAVVVTPDEYDAIPPSSLIELVDGVIHGMAPPSLRHQEIVDALKYALARACPPDLRVLREQEIRIEADHRRNPDVLIVHAGAVNLDATSYAPAEVVLAVEVVSPHTRTADRKHKPSEYAEAGIEHYWRVEPLPELTVHTYRLDETDVYEPTGSFAVGETIAAPGLEWASVPVKDLIPR